MRSRDRLPKVRCPRTMSHGERERSDRSERQRRGARTRGRKHGAHNRGYTEHREARTKPRLERERSDLNRRQRRALRRSLCVWVVCVWVVVLFYGLLLCTHARRLADGCRIAAGAAERTEGARQGCRTAISPRRTAIIMLCATFGEPAGPRKRGSPQGLAPRMVSWYCEAVMGI